MLDMPRDMPRRARAGVKLDSVKLSEVCGVDDVEHQVSGFAADGSPNDMPDEIRSAIDVGKE